MCIYMLHPAVAIESLDERSLALHCESLRMVELNATAADLLARLDGRSALRRVAAAMAADYGQPLDVVFTDMQETIAQMLDLGLVEKVFSGDLPASPADGSAS